MLRDACWLIFCQKEKPSICLSVFTYSRNCDVHVVKSTQWKRLSYPNITMHNLTLHIWNWRLL
jgi:hypothetical protein